MKLARFFNWLSAEVHSRTPGFRLEIAQNPRDFAASTYLADWKSWNAALLANGTELSDEELPTAASYCSTWAAWGQAGTGKRPGEDTAPLTGSKSLYI